MSSSYQSFITNSFYRLNLSLNSSFIPGKVRFHAYRMLIIFTLSIIITHLLSYNKLPFTAGYTFPLTSFMIISLFGLSICSLNWVAYSFYKPSENQVFKSQLLERIGFQLLSTIVFYSVLYALVILMWFGENLDMAHYLKYLMICATIITMEFLVFELFKEQSDPLVEAPESTDLLVSNSLKSVKVPYSDIQMFKSQRGIISLYSIEHKSLITNYSSLEEIEKFLPANQFFRVNRKSIVNRNVVKEIKRNKNRTLGLFLQLNGEISNEEIIISRYKRKEFLNWLES